MTPTGFRLAGLAAAFCCVAGAVAACGTAGSSGITRPHSPDVTSPARIPVARSSFQDCQHGPSRRAFAELVTSSGRVAWQDSLPTNPSAQGASVSPVSVTPPGQPGSAPRVDVVAEYATVYGLRESDGHRLWTWTGGQLIYGLWTWHGRVIVLSGQVSAHAELLAIAPSTGAVTWTLTLPRAGLLGSQAMTADGGLAMIVPDGTLEVADLASGRLRWAHKLAGALPSGPQPTPQAVNADVSPDPVAVGSVVVEASGTSVFGYDSRTGALAWTAAGMQGAPVLAATAGLVLMTPGAVGAGLPTAVVALSPATGRVAWRFDAGDQTWVEGFGPAGVVLATSGPAAVYLIDPATGRARWHAAASVVSDSEAGQSAIADVTAGDVITPEAGGPGQRGQIVDRSAADGSVRWAVPLAVGPEPVPVLTLGGQVVTVTNPQGSGGGTLSTVNQATGTAGWRVRMPARMQVAPALAPSGVLAQPTDPSYGCPLTGSAAGAAAVG
jgi:outer membrane protein assembly factor BamB